MTNASKFNSMFVKSRPLDHFWFQIVIDLGDELEGQGLYDVRLHPIVKVTKMEGKPALRMVVGGIQCVRRS